MHQPPRLLEKPQSQMSPGHPPRPTTTWPHTPYSHPGLHRHLVVTLERALLRAMASTTPLASGDVLLGGGNRPPGSLWREWNRCGLSGGSLAALLAWGFSQSSVRQSPSSASTSTADKGLPSRQEVWLWHVGQCRLSVLVGSPGDISTVSVLAVRRLISSFLTTSPLPRLKCPRSPCAQIQCKA